MLIDEVHRLLQGVSLDRAQAQESFRTLFLEEVPPARIGAFLALLESRGACAEEIAGFADFLAANAVAFPADPGQALDTCGTGGDGRGTFNISTVAALVAAAAGAVVLKHGNRAATSQSGSADLLEQLGIPIDLKPEQAARGFAERRFTFLFARQYHPILGKLAPIRSSIGFPTVFNLLGPLLNPARVRRQLIGVYKERMQELMAEALRLRGCDRAFVLLGSDGLDEATPLGPFRLSIVEGAAPIRQETRDPARIGLSKCTLAELQVAGPSASKAAALEVLEGRPGPKRDAVLLNAALALEVCGIADHWRTGFDRAADVVDRGEALALCRRLSSPGDPSR